MRTTLIAAALGTILLGAAPAHAADRLGDLTRRSTDELLALYRAGSPGPIPTGRVRGRALVRPGTSLAPALSRGAGLVWQGKVFEGDGTAINRFFGVRAVRGRVFSGPSLLDGAPAIILDYRDTSRVYWRYRDEIRQVAPGLYLGLMYDNTTRPARLVRLFAFEVAGG
jgi:hypothetical protein